MDGRIRDGAGLFPEESSAIVTIESADVGLERALATVQGLQGVLVARQAAFGQLVRDNPVMAWFSHVPQAVGDLSVLVRVPEADLARLDAWLQSAPERLSLTLYQLRIARGGDHGREDGAATRAEILAGDLPLFAGGFALEVHARARGPSEA